MILDGSLPSLRFQVTSTDLQLELIGMFVLSNRWRKNWLSALSPCSFPLLTTFRTVTPYQMGPWVLPIPVVISIFTSLKFRFFSLLNFLNISCLSLIMLRARSSWTLLLRSSLLFYFCPRIILPKYVFLNFSLSSVQFMLDVAHLQILFPRISLLQIKLYDGRLDFHLRWLSIQIF